MSKDDQFHPYIRVLQQQLQRRQIGRREFLRSATLLGLSASVAYSITGHGSDPGPFP